MGTVNAKYIQDPRFERHAEQPAGPEYKHDPLEGFPNGRKPRGMKRTGQALYVGINIFFISD